MLFTYPNSENLLPLHSLCQLLSHFRSFDTIAAQAAIEAPPVMRIKVYDQAINALGKKHIVAFIGEKGQNAYFEMLLGLGIKFTSTSKSTGGNGFYTEIIPADPDSQKAVKDLITFAQQLLGQEMTARR